MARTRKVPRKGPFVDTSSPNSCHVPRRSPTPADDEIIDPQLLDSNNLDGASMDPHDDQAQSMDDDLGESFWRGEASDDDDFQLDCAASGFGDSDDDEDDGLFFLDHNKGHKHQREDSFAPESSTPPVKTEDDSTFIIDDISAVKAPPVRHDGLFGRGQAKGETLAAYDKPVSHILDEDDQLMMDMREKGFSDRQIAQKFRKDGRNCYEYKSIGTRISRIKMAQAENVDFLLKEGYKEWMLEDDRLLIQAHAEADAEINCDIERLRAWRFRKVAEHMRRIDKNSMFSATACRDRYDALITGKAVIPSALDDNPAARLAEMEAYRDSREAIRAREEEQKQARHALDQQCKDSHRVRNAQKLQELADQRVAKETEKAERALLRAKQAQSRAQKAREDLAARLKRNAKIKQQQQDNIKQANPGKNTAGSANDSTASDDNGPPDPRGLLSAEDLTGICVDEGLAVAGKTPKALLAELRAAEDKLSMNELRARCLAAGLSGGGTKLQMKYRLALTAAHGCPSYDAGKKMGGK